MLDKYSLYGIPYSLYTGCARPYLIKNGISFRDLDEVLGPQTPKPLIKTVIS